MAIVYDPASGQAVWCLDIRVKDYLERGYRAEPVLAQPNEVPTPIDPLVAQSIALTGDLDLNSASLKAIADLPGVSTALARQIREDRPYRTVEDLIGKFSTVAWLTLRDRICLKDPEGQEEEKEEIPLTESTPPTGEA